MRIQLLLTSVPDFSIRNVVLAAYSSCSHLKNVFTGFIVSHVFLKKTPSSIKAGAIISISFPSQYRSQKFSGAVITSVDHVIKLNV